MTSTSPACHDRLSLSAILQNLQHATQLGGKRAYMGRLGKDRNPGESRLSVSSAKKASPPEVGIDRVAGERRNAEVAGCELHNVSKRQAYSIKAEMPMTARDDL